MGDDTLHRSVRVDFASNPSLPQRAAGFLKSREKPRNPRSDCRGNDRRDSSEPREARNGHGEDSVPQCDVRDRPANLRGVLAAVHSRDSRRLSIRGDGVSSRRWRGRLGAKPAFCVGIAAV